jgi:Protein of unknown function (DUF3570)
MVKKLMAEIIGKRLLPITVGWRFLPLGLASGLPQLVRGENQVDFQYENYNEDAKRMTVQTESAYFEQKLVDAFIAKGQLTYDGVSGATPTGTHQWIYTSPGTYKQGPIKLTHMEDNRRAASISFDWTLGRNTLTPGFAYSKETDYRSYGVSLNDALNFNEKNTTVEYGVAHDFDNVRQTDHSTGQFYWSDKQSTEAILGLSQLLSPDTVFAAAFTFGNDSGYLSDPYRLAEYVPNGFGFGVGVPERRPSHRNKEIVHASLTHYFAAVDGSLVGSYRFYNDSYGIVADTVNLTWRQWLLNHHLTAEPSFRFYEQSAADFYATQFYGPFTINPNGPPGMHSSDYRLSELYTLDAGLKLTYHATDWLRLSAGYHRYAMYGLDGKTSAAMYPKANVITVGISLVW